MVNKNAVEVRDVEQPRTDTRPMRSGKMGRPRKYHRKRTGWNARDISYLATTLRVLQAVSYKGAVYVKASNRGRPRKNFILN